MCGTRSLFTNKCVFLTLVVTLRSILLWISLEGALSNFETVHTGRLFLRIQLQVDDLETHAENFDWSESLCVLLVNANYQIWGGHYGLYLEKDSELEWQIRRYLMYFDEEETLNSSTKMDTYAVRFATINIWVQRIEGIAEHETLWHLRCSHQRHFDDFRSGQTKRFEILLGRDIAQIPKISMSINVSWTL